ncbi:MAG: T9SS type A sorting domain-containing protein [Cruoricaptor ignavus]|nr:T9SS type A sorting domain-containing protein [Cruoricaptor ignavus]
MKKLLFSMCATALLGLQTLTAQTSKDWNFSEGNWPNYAGWDGQGISTTVEELGFAFNVTSSNLMGAVEASNSGNFPQDGTSYTHRLKFNGGSYATGSTEFGTPVQRYMYIKVAGPSTISIWYRNGGGGARTLYLTDGQNVLTSNTHTGSSAPDNQLVTYNYTGGEGFIYLACNSALNVFRITATNVLPNEILSAKDVAFNALSTIAVAANGKVYLKKVDGQTDVQVYTTAGQLVKSLSTRVDSEFDLQSGIYIVTLKSERGTKSQKVLVK